MEVSQPQTVHIVRGPSGCGKTTFAKQLSEDIFASKILAYGPPHLRPKIVSKKIKTIAGKIIPTSNK